MEKSAEQEHTDHMYEKIKKLNGFNNGKDTTEGVGGRPAFGDCPQPIIDTIANKQARPLSDSEYLLCRINDLENIVNKLVTKIYDLEHPHKPGSMVPPPPPPPPDRIKEFGPVQLPPDFDPTYVKTTVTGPAAH